jgi:hypothetical protein
VEVEVEVLRGWEDGRMGRSKDYDAIIIIIIITMRAPRP